MTSIAHPVLPGAVPAIGGSGSAPTTPAERRLFQPAGSKAVRVGLGVAIAAVMAGDLYAVLRSPVSEGRGVGSSEASGATMGMSDGTAVGARFGEGGTVAVNPFSDAAYGAVHGLGSGPSPFVVARTAAPGVGAAPAAAPSTLPAAPTATPAGSIVLPTPVATPSVTVPTWNPPADTEGGKGDPGNNEETPAPSGPLAPVAEAVRDVPIVGKPVADALTQVDSQLPPAPAPVADTVETVVEPVVSVPSTVSSSLGLG